MESFSREFALFIDGIRIERGLSRIDLIDEVVSLSQYKRYLRGVAPIPNNVVIELADRLKYNITDLYSLYTKKYSKEDSQLREVYSIIQKYDYERAYLFLQDINDELLVSSFYKLFYDYMVIFTQHKLGRVSEIHVLSLYSDLIDYPNCMKNDSFNFVEISILNQIITISSGIGNYEAANLMFDKLTSNSFNYSSSNDATVLPALYYTLARVNFKQDNFERTNEVCELGIKTAIQYEILSGLPHLFFLNARALLRLNLENEAIISIKKCFLQLSITGNKNSFEAFLKGYNNDFDIPIEDLLKDVSDIIKK